MMRRPPSGLTFPVLSNPTASSVWRPLSIMSVLNPVDFGADRTGATNSLTALQATAAALPAGGGVIYFPDGTYRKDGVWNLGSKPVKLWARNRGATIFGRTNGSPNVQATRWLSATGAGVFGVRFTSDASVRGGSEEANQLTFSLCTLPEAVGNEVVGSEAVGIMHFGSAGAYTEGNYVHDTLADHIHHTFGSSNGYAWGNWLYNGVDDGIAIVSYRNETICSGFEIFGNTIISTQVARGYSVVGGQNVNIHHNVANVCGSAGILLASEDGFDSHTVTNVQTSNNVIYNCCFFTTSHTGILISGGNSLAPSLSNISGVNNTSYGAIAGPYRTEGLVNAGTITNTGMKTLLSDVPFPRPTTANVVLKDTTVMRTRDVSLVPAGQRPGCYRIHVTGTPGAFFQRFEYVVKGHWSAVRAFARVAASSGHYVVEAREGATQGYALLLTSVPVTLTFGVAGMTFAELRAPELDWLWQRIDTGVY